MHFLNPLNGIESRPSLRLNIQLKQTFTLPLQDSNGNSLLPLQDSQDRIHVFSKTADALDLFKNKSDSIYFYNPNHATLSIQGYVVGEEIETGIFGALTSWSTNFGATGANEITFSRPSPYQSVYTPTKILGDRSALEKYLNRNLLAVLTLYPQNYQGGEQLRLTLLDTVTGNIIYSTIHRNAAGPIGVAQSENNIFYYYWNTKNLRVEIGVLELYQKEIDWQRFYHNIFF